MSISKWTLADLVDFEVLLSEDERGADPELVRKRDRDIYLAISKFAPTTGESRKRVFRRWLESRRTQRFPGGSSPGDEVASLLSVLRFIFIIIGLAAARAVVWSFFRGAETVNGHPEPINVLWYGLVCIGVPFLLSVIAFWVLLAESTLPKLPRAPAFFRGTLLELLRPLFRRIAARATDLAGAEKRLSVETLVGAMRQRLHRRSDAVALQMLCLVQAFGLAFTAGVAAFSWIDCEFHGHVFGWQSTFIHRSADSVYGLVNALGQPWSWIEGDLGKLPTVEQVQDTQFLPFHDPAKFPPGAADAWAWFLILAAVTYGFLPRLVLYVLSSWQLRRALSRNDFDELRYEPLWNRLTSQLGIWAKPEDRETLLNLPSGPSPLGGALSAPAACLLVLPQELHFQGREEAISLWLMESKNWKVINTVLLPSEPAWSAASMEEISAVSWHGAKPRVCLVQEAFMPPVREVLNFLKALREALGSSSAILVGLPGRPGSGQPFGMPSKEIEVRIWQDKITSLGDPNLGAVSFIERALVPS